MSEPRKDKELTSDAKGKAKVETSDEDKSSSTTGSSDEEVKKCMDAMDFFTQKAKGIVIGQVPAAAAGKRRKRASSGLTRSISIRSELSEIGMSFDSDSDPTNADDIAKTEQKGKGKVEEESDFFQGSDTDSDEACKRMKKGRNDDDSDDDDGAGGGTGAGAHTDLSSLSLQVTGK
ncbi:hypothetical protein L1987_29452 [Smallanthus sonchifolius]|uniref:Uncharacterized protein n=1 Tax=Smallanthus sonchifolius TaxID=185202 RepID=A0ACB9I189_9ASTR|nr:hypothetical protein L1987_29452 [Smallanthus sonchifolius]